MHKTVLQFQEYVCQHVQMASSVTMSAELVLIIVHLVILEILQEMELLVKHTSVELHVLTQQSMVIQLVGSVLLKKTVLLPTYMLMIYQGSV